MELSIAQDFSRTPGPRYRREGKFSGEEFRDDVLGPVIRAAIEKGERLLVDLDGTAGYGTSFLEEAFGGLVRVEAIPGPILLDLLEFVSEEEAFLTDDIRGYISEAEGAKSAGET